jgi:hypothetical protein
MLDVAKPRFIAPNAQGIVGAGLRGTSDTKTLF